MGVGAPPTAWAMAITEMMVADYSAAFAFWTDVLGLAPSFIRPEQKLAHLVHKDGAQVMIYERDGDWEVAPMEPPFGRGVVVQVFVMDAAAVAARVAAQSWPFYIPLREKWRDWGDRMGGQREFLVQDPDGYLVMVAERIGERPLDLGQGAE
jgi:catechol 2,3-dioxygenase-like lactoylglutathione lyase family enzyme